MHIHILGICGTFMGSLALLAREKGFTITGSDQDIYPPMSIQLEAQGIVMIEGYDLDSFKKIKPDLVVIGNAMKRGNPVVEYILNENILYTSGPQFLSLFILDKRWVLSASGTHGKTTTASMLAWILADAGLNPGFLIGGIPKNFSISAKLGDSPFFVIEADEYDTAFFDKRSKFMHYKTKTLMINNLEFDHADIFDSLSDIKKQFHHLVRTIPSEGQIIIPSNNDAIEDVLDKGCWSHVVRIQSEKSIEGHWLAQPEKADCSEFLIKHSGKLCGSVQWQHLGNHNMNNALMAVVAAFHVGVSIDSACQSLCKFEGVKRRMELVGTVGNIKIYDDFAHHPTAIATTLEGIRAQLGQKKRIFVLIEPRSNTMKLGIHANHLAASTKGATEVLWYQPKDVSWSLAEEIKNSPVPAEIYDSTELMIQDVLKKVKADDHIIIMSNGGFNGLRQSLLDALKEKTD